MRPEDYCKNKSAPPGSSFYYASLYQPQQTKTGLLALFAFHYELLETLFNTNDPGVYRIKLQWWREELQRLHQGQPRHPVAEALYKLQQQEQLNAELLSTHLYGMEMLLIPSADTNLETWWQQQTQLYGTIWQCSHELMQQTDAQQQSIIQTNGALVVLLEILQNLHILMANGHTPFPSALLEKHGLTTTDLLHNHNPQSTCALFSEVITRIMNKLEQGYKEFPNKNQPQWRYYLIMNRLNVALCNEILADGCRLLEQKVILTPVRKLWIAWKTKTFAR